MTLQSADERSDQPDTGPPSGPLAAVSTGRAGLIAKLILVTLVSAELLIQVDQTIVNVALPYIQRDLGFSASGLPWVVNAYALMYGGLLLLGGRIGDVFGRRRVLTAGITIFTLSSVVCGLATDPMVMVVARGVQGVGGALTAPVVLSLIIVSFDEGPSRQRAMALWGSASAAGALVGLLIGGLLASGPGWPFSFFLALPIGLMIIVLSRVTLTESRADERPRLDGAGAVTITASLLLAVYAFLDAGTPWTSPARWGLLAASVALLAAFVVIERRVAHPVVPPRVFRRRASTVALAIVMLWGTAQTSYFYFVTIYLQDVLGFNAFQTGLAYVPLIGILLPVAQNCTKLVGRLGLVPVLVAGLGSIGLGMTWLGLAVSAQAYLITLLGPTVLVGIGLGLVMMPVMTAATSGASPEDAGAVSGLFATAPLIGGSLGLAVVSTVAAAWGGLQGTTTGFGAAFLTCAGVILGAVVLAVVGLRVRGGAQPPEAPEQESVPETTGSPTTD